MLNTLNRILILFGIDIMKGIRSVKELPYYIRTYIKYYQQNTADRWVVKMKPCLTDRQESSGTERGHYFLQDLYVAKRIFNKQPSSHYDVGSRVDGFVAHIATFMKVTIVDIRKYVSHDDNIAAVQVDIMKDLDPALFSVTESLSCLHTIEHFGLGRYGDNINSQGHVSGLKNMLNMLKPGGTLYLSTPIGSQRVEFNAHRVFGVKYLEDVFASLGLSVELFSYIDDHGILHHNASRYNEEYDDNYGCIYGCGIYILRKK